MYEDGHEEFAAPSGITTPRKELLLSRGKTKSDQDFCLDDQVVVFDKDGKRVEGVAKWAFPGKEYGVDDYIIGIETVRVWVALIQLVFVWNNCSLLCIF